MVKRIYQCWKSSDRTDITFATIEGIKELKQKGLIPEDAYLEYTLEAATFEEACAIHDLRQGWGAYKPMGEAEPCPKCNSWFYPQGSGECWRCGKIC